MKASTRLSLLLLAFVCAIGWSISEKIDPLFSSYDQSNVPGAVVGIFKDGEVLYAKGYGLADLEGHIAVTESTNFRLASLTKQFTAMSIAILANEGRLRLDESLQDIFPDFPNYGKKITIDHLVHHLSGLRDYESIMPNQPGQISDNQILELMKNQTGTQFTSGSRYSYSNTGYVLLSQIVEARSERSFPQFLAERVFSPLWMRGSKVYVLPGTDIENRAYGYTASGGGFSKTDQSSTSATQGDGGVYTSVRDLFYWDRALYGTALLSEHFLTLIFSQGKLNNGSPVDYGFGWTLENYRGLTCHSHTGSTIGFRTAIQRYPEKNFTVVVLINRAGSSPWTIARTITDRLLFQ